VSRYALRGARLRPLSAGVDPLAVPKTEQKCVSRRGVAGQIPNKGCLPEGIVPKAEQQQIIVKVRHYCDILQLGVARTHAHRQTREDPIETFSPFVGTVLDAGFRFCGQFPHHTRGCQG